ncbi:MULTISPECIES: HAD family hydrolase [unclassified Micromonospora]|uniref:HAD family hydrolase n=1 Tax=unclassified Micromonospora TaxID=2617518 RepID=UPI003631F835
MSLTRTVATPSAALFDLDGTLVDTEMRSRTAWHRLFTTHGVPCDAALLATFAGRRGHEVLTERLHLFPEGSTVDALFDQAVSFLSDPGMPAARPVPGAAELVRDLHVRGVPAGVVTSALRVDAEAMLDMLGVREFLTVLVTAEDVRSGKPDPEGYLTGCAALGVAPEHVVGFEDAPPGVAAVKAAGMFCVGITTSQPAAALDAADLIVTDLTQVAWPPARTEERR